MSRPRLPRDDQDRLIWDWICPVCHTEWTSGDGRCPNCNPAAPVARGCAADAKARPEEESA